MLCEVGSSFTTSMGLFACTAITCGSYKQPFWVITTGSLGGSNCRLLSPSEIKTSTFCNPPLESVVTSVVETGPGCCLAQLGSAAMLMGLALGRVPSNFTWPLTAAAPTLDAADGPPAFTTCLLQIEIPNIRAMTRKTFFSFMLHLEEDYPQEFS